MIRNSNIPLILVTLAVGVSSGVSGLFLALLLKGIQHISYGYDPFQWVSHESFLQGVMAASPQRRMIVLSFAGLIAGIGWWTLFRYGKPIVSLPTAIESKNPLPGLTTIIHALLQIITIALGSPLGREAAPREVGAYFADRLARNAGLTVRQIQIMVACGAGAGLAAVYNVPFAGTLFVLEVLLATFAWDALLPAMVTASIAVVISWIGLGNRSMYDLSEYSVSPSLMMWSLVTGPIFGLCAYGFRRLTAAARRDAPRNGLLPLFCIFNFIFIGILAAFFPAILGNGKSPVQLEFGNELTIYMSLVLLGLRVLVTWSSLRAGSQGGLLTPSLANGALLAVVLGGVWNNFLPGTSLNSYAIVGATSFLAAAQKMPITAVALIFEFTRFKFTFGMPILIAVVGSLVVFYGCETKYGKP